jgi:RNA polymerase sigma-70 factor (ECF subfamily)
LNWQDNDLLTEHYDRIKRYIAYKAGSDQADDLTQQVFLKANQSLDSFQNKSSLYTWLYSIATNTIINEARRSSRAAGLFVNRESNDSRFMTTDFTKEVDFKIDLGTSLNKLDRIDQEILTLRYVADYSFRDIAKLLKMNETSLKSRLYRCLGKMRNDLESWHVAEPFNPKQYILMVNKLETGQSGPEFQRVTDDFMAILRKNFRRITSALNYTPEAKVTYEIYPDQEALLGRQYHTVKFTLGQFGRLNLVKIISPLNPGPNHDYQTVLQYSLSLYAKALAQQMNPQIPVFLLYGIGEYIGREWSRNQVQAGIASVYKQLELPSIKYMRVMDPMKFMRMRGRELSYTMLDFIVTRFGWDAFHRLLRDPVNLEAVLQRTPGQFELEWKQFMMERYMDAESCSSGIVMTSEQPDQEEHSLTILLPDHKHRVPTFTKYAQAFESAQPGIKVKVTTMPATFFYGNKLMEQMNGPHPVDLIFWPYDSELSRQGLFADLHPFYKKDGTTPDDFFKPLVDLVSENGQLTAIPMCPQPLAVFYNKEWFERAKLPEPERDWTWEQFLTISATLKETNFVGVEEIYGSAVPIILDFYESLAQSNGGSILSPDNNHATGYLDSESVNEAFALLMKGINNHDFVKKTPDATKAVVTDILSGLVGMSVGRIGLYPLIASRPNLKQRIGVAPLPRMTNGIRANAV